MAGVVVERGMVVQPLVLEVKVGTVHPNKAVLPAAVVVEREQQRQR